LLDELGHRYSTIEEEQTIFLWKSCELFVDNADEKKREEEDNKKKLRIDVDAGLEITANHVVFFFSDKSHADEWKTQPVQVARMDQELIGSKFRIIASNLDADEGECIRVLRK
jgi:3D (Asp-Asp-Asp) domain-containing protein